MSPESGDETVGSLYAADRGEGRAIVAVLAEMACEE
jgi:hypothetical protein